MTWRVVVTGSECTGKTTIARALAERLGTPWVAEAAREYAEERAVPLSAADVEPIARATIAAHDAALDGAPSAVVFDTDLVSTVVYARAYYGHCPAWIAEAARARRGDLYVLCEPDLMWEADGVRDRPSPADRAAMHAAFASGLAGFDIPCIAVRGSGPARIEAAVAAAVARRPVTP